mgnify:CR=1 FL=1
MNAKDLIAEAISLPIEERAIVVETILRSFNPPESSIDKKWAVIARQRLNAIRSGDAEPISGDEVFNRIWERFSL